jgi:uncharacterized protein YbjT (DUF2867 family)
VSVVLVTGGSGTLGRSVVAGLEARGDDVRVLSRRAGNGTHVGDLATGVGVSAAAVGVDLIVHAASDTHRLGRADVRQTRNLLQAATDVRHLLYVSIVGIDEIPFAYYRHKLACEREIAASGVPHTILRATQFHELIAMVLGAVRRLPVAPLPLDFRFQSIASSEVASAVVDLVGRDPTGALEHMGGPEVLTLGEMAGAWRAAHGRPRVVRLPLRGRVAAGFRAGRNTCPDHAVGRQSWEEFVASA